MLSEDLYPSLLDRSAKFSESRVFKLQFFIILLSLSCSSRIHVLLHFVKVSIKEKHKLYQQFIFSQTPVNAKLYKTFKNRLKTLIRKAEINYYLDAFNDKKHSIKGEFRVQHKLGSNERASNFQKNEPSLTFIH